MLMGKGKYLLWSILFILIFSLSTISRLFTDYWWFESLSLESVFLIGLKWKILLGLASAIVFFLLASLNLLISNEAENNKKHTSIKFKIGLIAVVSFFIGIIFSEKWFIVLQNINISTFNILDPIFFKDISYYVFSLPVLFILWNFLMTTLVLSTLVVFGNYFYEFLINLFKPSVRYDNVGIPNYSLDLKTLFKKLKRKAIVHISILSSLFFLLIGFYQSLARYTVMYKNSGLIVGATYADVIAYFPIMKLLIVASVIIALMFYVWIFYISKQPRLKKRHLLAFTISIYLLFAFVGPVIIPGLVQSFRVTPNELNLEEKYIEYNIEFTKKAYGLDNVEEKEYNANLDLTAEKIANAKSTIDNARILDYRPLTQTYKQTQEIRLYYDLKDIDIDRYYIENKYTQVMLSVRELDQTQITTNAQTWVNLHMIYTHGYGVVMSPVNSVTKQGLPNYLIQDIPPINNVGDSSLDITRPEIYYGEVENDYVLVNTNTDEFDYPKGDSNQYINYDGTGGVVLDSLLKKVMMALRFGDIRILLSSDVNKESKIMFDRSIQKRIKKVTPFLALDADPYIVINEGKLFWIQDAYVLSSNYPYSESVGNFNYIRNSVKIIVDTYNGKLDYYIVSEDPLVNTYAKIYPKLFKEFEEMPNGLKQHLRYPVDLFKIQSEIYNTYHMNNPSIFYNKEDAWQIPNEVYGTGQQVKVEPYYIIMKLPGETLEEFVLMTTFTPIKKNNMIAWLAARSDGENYGKLLLYKFPKDKLIFGPLQIEAKFDQDSLISEQLTLWSQQGSRVTRGNLLVIPIEDSILYIEPLYIQAETGQLPELKRILVSDGESVVMEEDLAKALQSLFGKAKETVIANEELNQSELIDKANKLYANILQSMSDNNWTGIGNNLEDLGEVLSELK